jgi:tRNA-(ms[2]io[6]A)-hydroxylase
MLALQSRTPAAWVDCVARHLSEVLVDHAHCEKKAAGSALGLVFTYIEHAGLARRLAPIVREELGHFEEVLDLLSRRGIPLRGQPPSAYGGRLARLARRTEPGRAVDRLLVAALIEARSCERMSLLAMHLPDPELRDLYARLLESEARHHSTYLLLAQGFMDDSEVRERLLVLAREEARILALPDPRPRLHATPLALSPAAEGIATPAP